MMDFSKSSGARRFVATDGNGRRGRMVAGQFRKPRSSLPTDASPGLNFTPPTFRNLPFFKWTSDANYRVCAAGGLLPRIFIRKRQGPDWPTWAQTAGAPQCFTKCRESQGNYVMASGSSGACLSKHLYRSV